jgi:hypothetical protein
MNAANGGQSTDEWKLLLESVMMAGIAVTAADLSGLWGLLKERFASSSELMKAKTDLGANPLIRAVVSDFDTAQGRSTARDGLREKLQGIKPSEITAKCIETLRQAGAVVDAKAPGEAAAFKGWLRQISQHVAEAAPEGGFSGYWRGAGAVSQNRQLVDNHSSNCGDHHATMMNSRNQGVVPKTSDPIFRQLRRDQRLPALVVEPHSHWCESRTTEGGSQVKPGGTK